MFASQSTYCSTMVQHCEALGRAVQVVNLDPAAELFSYPVMAGERRRPAARGAPRGSGGGRGARSAARLSLQTSGS